MDSYFPIKIEIVDTKEIKIVEHHEIPVGITFKVLETKVNKFPEIELDPNKTIITIDKEIKPEEFYKPKPTPEFRTRDVLKMLKELQPMCLKPRWSCDLCWQAINYSGKMFKVILCEGCLQEMVKLKEEHPINITITPINEPEPPKKEHTVQSFMLPPINISFTDETDENKILGRLETHCPKCDAFLVKNAYKIADCVALDVYNECPYCPEKGGNENV